MALALTVKSEVSILGSRFWIKGLMWAMSFRCNSWGSMTATCVVWAKFVASAKCGVTDHWPQPFSAVARHGWGKACSRPGRRRSGAGESPSPTTDRLSHDLPEMNVDLRFFQPEVPGGAPKAFCTLSRVGDGVRLLSRTSINRTFFPGGLPRSRYLGLCLLHQTDLPPHRVRRVQRFGLGRHARLA